jgi:hypothetical protein
MLYYIDTIALGVKITKNTEVHIEYFIFTGKHIYNNDNTKTHIYVHTTSKLQLCGGSHVARTRWGSGQKSRQQK